MLYSMYSQLSSYSSFGKGRDGTPFEKRGSLLRVPQKRRLETRAVCCVLHSVGRSKLAGSRCICPTPSRPQCLPATSQEPRGQASLGSDSYTDLFTLNPNYP